MGGGGVWYGMALLNLSEHSKLYIFAGIYIFNFLNLAAKNTKKSLY